MDDFWERSQNFFAIIIGAIIIGGFIYFGLQKPEVDVAPKTVTQFSAQNSTSSAKINSSATIAGCGASENTIVTKVIDGDTVVVEGGYHVRLLGMDADEKGYPCYDSAKTRIESLILGKQIRLEKDITDLDQYGRCLRYIFVGDTNIDVQLVKEGLAVARFYQPDVKYKAEITAAEKQAETSGVGCKWKK
ncbi:MAG: thermonuclease family protein [Candidatus Staskawiczbacteria bacterium]|nr:thermonuclease family protein [Candidatus Staskawiczbacteria bacterium]